MWPFVSSLCSDLTGSGKCYGHKLISHTERKFDAINDKPSNIHLKYGNRGKANIWKYKTQSGDDIY